MFHNAYFVENIHLLKGVGFNVFYMWSDYRMRRKKHNLEEEEFNHDFRFHKYTALEGCGRNIV